MAVQFRNQIYSCNLRNIHKVQGVRETAVQSHLFLLRQQI